jgi:hypothetical protein
VYASDARSFLFVMITVQLLLFAIISKNKKIKITKYIVLLLFFSECLHGVYFSIKNVVHANAVRRQVLSGSGVRIVTNKILEKNNANAILITDNELLRRYATLKKIKAFPLTKDCRSAIIDPASTIYVVTGIKDTATRNICFFQNHMAVTDTLSFCILQTYKPVDSY